MARRLLLLLDQMPQDPASGAARTTHAICRFLAASGRFEVAVIATTATERALPHEDPFSFLRSAGYALQIDRHLHTGKAKAAVRFNRDGIAYTLLDTGKHQNTQWEAECGAQFDAMFDAELRRFKPDLVFTYGGHPAMVQRYRRARQSGALIVFGLWNHGYLKDARFFELFNAVLTPSQYLTDKYRSVLGIDSTPLPTPMVLEEVVAPERDAIFITYVNPSIEKGVMFMAQFANQLSLQRPDIPLLVYESRGTAGTLVQAGLLGGFDLRRHENIMISPGVAQPRDVFTGTRVLIVPSVGQETAGRVASEALLNGLPPVVSDRGGLAEECRGAGTVLPLPDALTPATQAPVSPEVVRPWLDSIVPLFDDEALYAQECKKAAQASAVYLPENLAPKYVAFFDGVLGPSSV